VQQGTTEYGAFLVEMQKMHMQFFPMKIPGAKKGLRDENREMACKILGEDVKKSKDEDRNFEEQACKKNEEIVKAVENSNKKQRNDEMVKACKVDAEASGDTEPKKDALTLLKGLGDSDNMVVDADFWNEERRHF